MLFTTGRSVHLVVDDRDVGLRYRFALNDLQFQQLTVAQLQQMVVEAARDAAASASYPTKATAAPPMRRAGPPMQRRTNGISYESTIIPIDISDGLVAHTAASSALLPGSFLLLDEAENPLRDGGERVAVYVDGHGDNTPLRVARNRHHQPSQPSAEEAHTHAPSSTATSGVFFEIGSDNDEDKKTDNPDSSNAQDETQTVESVSFHEDMVSVTFNALMPSENIASSMQSVQFESELGDDAEMRSEVEFDTISFATTETSRSLQKTRVMPRDATPASVVDALGCKKMATTISNPVACMTVRQRFEYYKARGNRKKAAFPPPAAAPTAPAAAPAPASVHPTGDITTTTAPVPPAVSPSITPSTAPMGTAARKKVKKSAVTKVDVRGKHATVTRKAADTTSATLSENAATTPASERELKLVALVQQLQDDVQALLLQSHTDASRIAALRSALTEAKKEYRVLHEAHCSSLNQLNAYAAQIAAGVLPVPPQLEEPVKDGAAVDDNALAEPAEQEAPVLSTATRAEAREHATGEQNSRTEETPEFSPRNSADGEGASVVSPAVHDEAPPPATVQEPVLQTNGDAAHAQTEHEDEKVAEEEGAPAEAAQTAQATLNSEAAETGAQSGMHETAALATTSVAPPVSPHVPATFATTPMPALHQLSEAEVRALLKQLGYIYHNRLLRRENALLMCQLHLLTEQAKRRKKRKSAGGSHRLLVVVRIRPVGLPCAAATAAEVRGDGLLTLHHVSPPAALISPDIHSLRSSSGGPKVLSLQERSMAEGHHPLYPSSVVSPLLSPHYMSLMSKEQAATTAAAAAAGMPVAVTDVFLQCDVSEKKLQVRNPESFVNTTTATTTASSAAGGSVTRSLDRGAVLRGVRIFGPPLPQSLSSLVSAPPSDATADALDASNSTHLHSTTAELTTDKGVSALRVAAAAQQRSLYEETVAPLLDNALRGESGTVLAYGQVGSGKTYTMFGDCSTSEEAEVGEAGIRGASRASTVAAAAAVPEVLSQLPAEAGVVPRAIADLFNQLRDRAAAEELLLRSLYASRHDAAFQAAMLTKASPTPSEASAGELVAVSRTPMCEVQCSMVELYGDKVRDLLADKLEVPIYEEFLATSTGMKGSAAYRSSSAERRLQRQLRQAQAAQLSHRESSAAGSVRQARSPVKLEETDQQEQRRILGYRRVSPECVLRPTDDGGARVVGATQVTIHNTHEAMLLIRRGLANRETHETPSNAQSSRSHLIFTVTLKQQQWSCVTSSTEDVALGTSKEETDADVSAEDAGVTTAAAAVGKKPHKKTKAGTADEKKLKKTVKAKTKTAPTAATKSKTATPAAAEDGGVRQTATEPAAAKPAKKTKKAVMREESVNSTVDAAAVTTAAELEKHENAAQDRYLRRRTVKSVTSQLVFVDLAGTDRGIAQGSTGDNTERLREAQAIGKSLVALGDVMSILYSGSGVSSSVGKPTARADGGGGAYVPFRSHKLTMLLRDALVKPSTCVVLACVALSEAPMSALLSDTAPVARLSISSMSVCSVSPAWQALMTTTSSEKQYWRLATDRLLAALRSKPSGGVVSKHARESVVTASPSNEASMMTATATPASSQRPSTRLSEVAGKRASTSKSTATSSCRPSALLMDMHQHSVDSDDDEAATATGRKSGSQQGQSPAVQHLDVTSKHTSAGEPFRFGAPRRSHQPEEQSVDPELTAQLHAIQANADAEDASVAGALWITPRETVSTLLFLSRLWKA
jgi:hypothetical protein